MKLGTHVSRNNIHVYTKSIPSHITLALIMIRLCPLFDLEKSDYRWRSLRGALLISNVILLNTVTQSSKSKLVIKDMKISSERQYTRLILNDR